MKRLPLMLASATLPFGLSAQMVINEINFDPAFDGEDPTVGDANGDGTRSAREDEFVELVNTSGASLDLTGWTVSDNQGVMHTFGPTTLAAGQAVVIFGGGTPNGAFGGSVVLTANGDWGGLGNGGDSVRLDDDSAAQVAFHEYLGGDANDESLVLATELDQNSGYITHSSAVGSAGATISPGTQVSGALFGEGDLLTVTISPDTFSEGAGAQAATGTVTRSGDTSASLMVNLSSDNENEATVPASVMIPAGQPSTTFDVAAVDDATPDGDQSVTITASGTDIFSGVATVTVTDDEDPIPTIQLSPDPATISENGGESTVTLEVSAASPTGYTFNLSVDDPSELAVPETVTVAPNETTATFTATGQDDAENDGPQTVLITASDPDFTIPAAVTNIIVNDDEGFAAPDVVINELRIDNIGTDDDEYIELYSPTTGPVSLDRLSIVVIGDSSAGSGVVERVFDLTGETLNDNYFLIGSDRLSGATPDLVVPGGQGGFLENSDNFSYLLVADFSGTQGDDLDSEDDGELETKPWAAILSGVSLIEEPNGDDGSGNAIKPSGTEWDYSEDLGIPGIGPDRTFVPGHVYRSPNGSGEWLIGPFVESDGDPDADPPIPPVSRLDTPGAENGGGGVVPVETIQINSFTMEFDSGRGVINASNLGTKIWVLEFSDDLNQESAWTPVPGGASEQDQPDGTTNFVFFEEPPLATTRFYRLVESE